MEEVAAVGVDVGDRGGGVAGEGACEMSWFQAASLGRDGARGESDDAGCGNTWQAPRLG